MGKRLYLKQTQPVFVSLVYLIQDLSVIYLEIIHDSNKLPNHLIDGWEECC